MGPLAVLPGLCPAEDGVSIMEERLEVRIPQGLEGIVVCNIVGMGVILSVVGGDDMLLLDVAGRRPLFVGHHEIG